MAKDKWTPCAETDGKERYTVANGALFDRGVPMSQRSACESLNFAQRFVDNTKSFAERVNVLVADGESLEAQLAAAERAVSESDEALRIAAKDALLLDSQLAATKAELERVRGWVREARRQLQAGESRAVVMAALEAAVPMAPVVIFESTLAPTTSVAGEAEETP